MQGQGWGRRQEDQSLKLFKDLWSSFGIDQNESHILLRNDAGVHKKHQFTRFLLLIWFINILGDFYSSPNMLTIRIMEKGRNFVDCRFFILHPHIKEKND